MRTKESNEAKQLEGMLKDLQEMEHILCFDARSTELYQATKEKFENRYHELTGRYYHLRKEQRQ